MTKISDTYQKHLDALPPSKFSRAIIFLKPEANAHGQGRPTAEDRFASLEFSRQRTEAAWEEVDDILDRYGGKRLSSRLGALNGILVEATPPAIRALGELEEVQSILEDQQVTYFET